MSLWTGCVGIGNGEKNKDGFMVKKGQAKVKVRSDWATQSTVVTW